MYPRDTGRPTSRGVTRGQIRSSLYNQRIEALQHSGQARPYFPFFLAAYWYYNPADPTLQIRLYPYHSPLPWAICCRQGWMLTRTAHVVCAVQAATGATSVESSRPVPPVPWASR